MFDRADALLVIRALVIGLCCTAVVLWAALTLGLSWRVLMAVAGG